MVPVLTIGELFAGILGFSQGMERYGFTPIWAVEKDKHAKAVIRIQRPGLEIISDVDDPAVLGLRTPDVITFGSPCTDLSVAGEQAGIDGEHSRLFFRAIDIIDHLRPAWALFENVPNAIGINGGEDFRRMVRAFTDIGYSLAWRVLDAQLFGPPQRRRRVFIVATDDPCIYTGAQRCRQVLFNGGGLCGDSDEGFTPWAEFAGLPFGSAGDSGGLSVAGTLGAQRNGHDDPDRMTFIPFPVGQIANSVGWNPKVGDPSPSITRAGNGQGVPGLAFIPFPSKQISRPTCRLNPAEGDPSPPLLSSGEVPSIAYIPFHPQQVTRPGSSVTGPGDPVLALTGNSGGGGAPAVAMCLSKGERFDASVETFIVHSMNSEAMTGGGDAAAAFTSDVARCLDSNGAFASYQGGTLAVANTVTASAGHHGYSSPRGDGSDNLVVAHALRRSDGRRGAGAKQDGCDNVVLMNPLTTNPSGGKDTPMIIPDDRRVRRLTPTECERLQGMPDGWTQEGLYVTKKSTVCRDIVDGPRYAMLGNAVNVAVSAWLGYQLAREIHR